MSQVVIQYRPVDDKTSNCRQCFNSTHLKRKRPKSVYNIYVSKVHSRVGNNYPHSKSYIRRPMHWDKYCYNNGIRTGNAYALTELK